MNSGFDNEAAVGVIGLGIMEALLLPISYQKAIMFTSITGLRKKLNRSSKRVPFSILHQESWLW